MIGSVDMLYQYYVTHCSLDIVIYSVIQILLPFLLSGDWLVVFILTD
jgi:hypothetical protein